MLNKTLVKRRVLLGVFVLMVLIFASCKQNDKDLHIPVYDYSGLEPFLNKDNDTLYVVNFWATWCAPCIKEWPYFEELSKEYSNQKLDILMVSLDFPNQLDKSLYPFVKNRKSDLKVVLLDDPAQNIWIDKINAGWSGAIPATLVYKGKNRVFIEGPVEYSDLVNAINKVNNQ